MLVGTVRLWLFAALPSVTEDHGVASAIARDFAVGVLSLALPVALPSGQRLALLLVPP